MELYKLQQSQFEVKRTDKEKKEMILDLDSIGMDHNAVKLDTCILL